MKSLKFLTIFFIYVYSFSTSELKAVKIICEDVKESISDPFLSNHISVRRQINIINDNDFPFYISTVKTIVNLMNNNIINISHTTFKFSSFTEERYLEQIRNFILTLAVLPNLTVAFEPSQDNLKNEFLMEQKNKTLDSSNPFLARDTKSL